MIYARFFIKFSEFPLVLKQIFHFIFIFNFNIRAFLGHPLIILTQTQDLISYHIILLILISYNLRSLTTEHFALCLNVQLSFDNNSNHDRYSLTFIFLNSFQLLLSISIQNYNFQDFFFKSETSHIVLSGYESISLNTEILLNSAESQQSIQNEIFNFNFINFIHLIIAMTFIFAHRIWSDYCFHIENLFDRLIFA